MQKPLTTLMTSTARSTAPEDLRGKRVGTAGIAVPDRLPEDDPRATPASTPRTVKETHVGFNLVPAMLSRDVDATLGAFWNYEGTDLRRRGRKPTIMRMEKLGVPTYNELVFVARRKDLDRGLLVEAAALPARHRARATSALRANPNIGVDALLKVDPGLERGLQTDVVADDAARLLPRPTATIRSAGMEPSEWEAYGDWMYEQKLLKQPPDAAEALTNEFLPGRGAGPAGNRDSVSIPAAAAMTRYVPASPFHSP